MAQKRMFSNLVIGSDDFLEMPDSSQNLYFHLSMNADDDGFVDKWKSIMRMTGKKEDDLKILIAKAFVIPFDNGLIVIRHWKLNNYIQKDRYKETIHKDEKALLKLDENDVYNLDTNCIHSIDKSSIEKISIDKSSSSSVNNLYNPDVEKIQQILLETIGTTNINNIKECVDYLDKLPIELIEYALRKTARIERPSWQYAIPILDGYISKKIKTVDEAKADDLKHKGNYKKVQSQSAEEEFLNEQE